MIQKTLIFVFLLGAFEYGHGRQGFYGDQEWGHVTVRKGADMFYWLHYTTANVSSYFEKPLLIWLQGGPGVSSTGYGNFEEIGPLNLNLTSRKHTLVKDYNVLFIDSPVETGFSFTYDHGSLPETDGDVAKDLLQCIKGFLKKYPKFVSVPTYVIGQSYGGKIAAYLASDWLQYQKKNVTIGNLKGVALISAWISPIDSILSWGPYLYNNKLINKTELRNMNFAANRTRHAVETQNWRQAYNYYMRAVKSIPTRLNIYNLKSTVLKEMPNYFKEVDKTTQNLMHSKVGKALNLTSESYFIVNNFPVKSALSADFLKPAVDKVEYLLNNTDLKVVIFNGVYDLVENIAGTVQWFEKLHWKNSDECLRTYLKNSTVTYKTEVYVHDCQNLKMYLVAKAGHMVPSDNPIATKQILKDLTSLNTVPKMVKNKSTKRFWQNEFWTSFLEKVKSKLDRSYQRLSNMTERVIEF